MLFIIGFLSLILEHVLFGVAASMKLVYNTSVILKYQINFRMLTLMMAASLLAFLLAKASPIDPVMAYIGGDSMSGLTQEARLVLEEKWELNQPVFQQYLHWISSLLHGDWGHSLLYNRNVLDIIVQRAGASLALMGIAWVLSGVLGFLLGIIAGIKQGGLADKLVRLYSVTLASSPTFWIGLLLLMIFGVWLKWFPIGMGAPMGKMAEEVSFLEKVHHIFLPALTLSITGVANIALHTREKLVEIWNRIYYVCQSAGRV